MEPLPPPTPFLVGWRRPSYLLFPIPLDLGSAELKLEHHVFTLPLKCLQELDVGAKVTQHL